MTATTMPQGSLAMMLRALKLPTVALHAEEVAAQAEREAWTFGRYLHHLIELELHERRRRRIERSCPYSCVEGDFLGLQERRGNLLVATPRRHPLEETNTIPSRPR